RMRSGKAGAVTHRRKPSIVAAAGGTTIVQWSVSGVTDGSRPRRVGITLVLDDGPPVVMMPTWPATNQSRIPAPRTIMQRIPRDLARKYAFDWRDEPLLRVKPGEPFEIET